MRIGYLSLSPIASYRADGVHVMKMCAALGRRGYDVMLCALSGPLNVSPFEFYGVKENFHLVRRSLSNAPGLAGVKFGYESVRDARYSGKRELLYARHIYGLMWALRLGESVIFEAHAPPRSQTHRAILRWAFGQPSFRRLIVISKALRDEYRALFPRLSPENIRVAPDAADLCRKEGASRVRLRVRASPGAPAVGYLGALYPGKGMEVIARLVPLLAEMDFHIVGGDEKSVRQWHKRLPYPNVHFYGQVPHSETSAWIEAFDFVLLPLQHSVASLPTGGQDIARWTSPMKMFEYMAHGKPMVASDLPVLREVLEHGRNALIVAADDPEQWARALRRLASDGNLRHHLGANARADVERDFTWDKRVERVLEGLEH